MHLRSPFLVPPLSRFTISLSVRPYTSRKIVKKKAISVAADTRAMDADTTAMNQAYFK